MPAAIGTRATGRIWVAWLAGLGVLTALLTTARAQLSSAHVALAYLLFTQVASATAGRRLGLTIATLSFVCFDLFLLPPYGTLAIEHSLDWIVLAAFLASAALTAELFHRLRQEAYTARAHASEIARLASVAQDAAALREADRLKDALLASVSHDLRTPLTTIKALAHEIAATGDSRAEEIEEESDRLTAFVTDLLALSRLRGGAVDLHVEPNEAEDLVGVVLQQISGVATGRTIRASFDPAESLLFGSFDFSASVRIVVNLLENAIKHSPPAEAVTLRVFREGEWLVFEVADRGAGVDPADAAMIFRPFVRGRGADPDMRGSGLGLAIARGLAEAQQGTVTYSPRAGGGSVFALRVPAIDIVPNAASLARH